MGWLLSFLVFPNFNSIGSHSNFSTKFSTHSSGKGWQLRKSTYEDGTVKWSLLFALYYSQYGPAVNWEDISEVTLWKKNPETANFKKVLFKRKNEREEYYKIVNPGYFDPQVSWLRPNWGCDNPFSCPFRIHESTAEIEISEPDEPQPNDTYELRIKLIENKEIAISPQWIMPKTMNLKPVPLRTAMTITNKIGEVVTTNYMVPAISIKESDDGSLVVQYIEPFIETEPPPIHNDPNGPDAWRGTQVRLGISLSEDPSDPENPMYLIWPDIPSNVGAVVFPKEVVNFMKNRVPEFTGTVYFRIQHRDRLNAARWLTGTGSFPFTFVNPDPIGD